MKRYLIVSLAGLAIFLWAAAAAGGPVNLSDIAEDDVVYFMWSTNDADGAGITRATDGTIRVYKDDGAGESVAGITDTEDFDGTAGLHLCTINTAADAFYATGHTYHVTVDGATIDGVANVVGVLARFTIEDAYVSVDEIEGTDATDVIDARTLAAAAYFDPAADTVATVTTLTGHTVQTGDNFARLGAPAGASVSADVLAIKTETALIVADTGVLQTDWADGGRLDLLVDAIKAKTDNLPASPAAVGSAMTLEANAITAAVIATAALGTTEFQAGYWAALVSSVKSMTIDGQTFEDLTAWNSAMLLGTVSGAHTDVATVKQAGGASTRVVMTTDIYGNRYAVTLTAP
jgi:hypothetical protein